MGSFCSKSGTHTDGGHTVLGPSSSATNPVGPSPRDDRIALAKAAEQRLKAAKERGVNPTNPNHGRLAAKIDNQHKSVPESRQEERLVWD